MVLTFQILAFFVHQPIKKQKKDSRENQATTSLECSFQINFRNNKTMIELIPQNKLRVVR